jgi:tetratricopeptide (TPR) repeat protein
LVIDYAAQCHEALARWFDRLAGQKLDTKLRILLLDREAPEGFGWWRELTGSGLNTARERRDLFYAARPRQLPDLSDLEELRELMEAALQGARDLRSIPSHGGQIPRAAEDPDFDRTLAQPQCGNPLALVMAGVIALDHGARAALALRHLEAARRLGRRELDRFAALAQSRRISSNAVRHLVAFNELADGIPVADLRESVVEELAASQQTVDLDVVLALLEQELRPRTGSEEAARGPRLATIQPDLIGEAAIIESFSGERSRELAAGEVVLRAYTLGGEDAARVLIRLLQDFAYAVEEESATDQEKATARRVMRWLLNLSQQLQDPEHLLPLVSALPEQTTILREPAAELTQRLAILFQKKAEGGDNPGARNIAAALLNNLANRLSDLGRRDEALAAAEEAVRQYRTLAAARPDAFTPDLAAALSNLANRLSALGRGEEALAAAEEAVRHYRMLAAARPDAFTPDLALALNSLANALSDLGRHGEALTVVEEAVRLHRALAAARPDAFTPNLAAALNNLAASLSDLGRREEALTAVEEAVRFYRALAAPSPDAFTPGLARSLNNLANRLSALGRREEALTAAEEAVRLRRALAATRPDVFGVDLARSLWVLGDRYGEAGRSEAAIGTLVEGLRLLSPIFIAVPAAVVGVMVGLVQSYLAQCEAAGHEPDAELLGPAIAEFERMNATEDNK